MTSVRKIRVCRENVVWVINKSYLAVYVEDTYIQIFIFSEGRSMTVNFSSAFQLASWICAEWFCYNVALFLWRFEAFLKASLC